jgi:hypothetical protein
MPYFGVLNIDILCIKEELVQKYPPSQQISILANSIGQYL